MVGHFKQLCNKTQERVPVAVYVLPLGPDCDSPYYQLATASEIGCTKPKILFATGCTIDTHSPLVILCSCLSLCWLAGSGQGPEVCWSGSALGFRGLPTSYRLIPSKRNPAIVCELLPPGVLNTTNPSNWMACISFEQDGMVQNCTTWESPSQN